MLDDHGERAVPGHLLITANVDAVTYQTRCTCEGYASVVKLSREDAEAEALRAHPEGTLIRTR
jgi:hypothetical protein